MKRTFSLGLPVCSFGIAAALAATAVWTVMASPNRGYLSNVLNGVAAVADDDAWAVGHWYDNRFASYRTLAERWDGTRWLTAPTPNVGNGYNELYGVAATSPVDGWAVGYSRETPYTGSRTLILHWDGAVWRVVPSPNPGPTENVLSSAVALAADDAWAVGWYYDAQRIGRPLIAHWDGSRWSTVATPVPSTYYSLLAAVCAAGPGDVWAGGYAYVNGRYGTLLMHWEGKSWTVVPSPNVGTRANRIRSVSAVAFDDVWAVGDSQTRSLLQHWDGATWSVVDHPTTGTYSTLWGVSAAPGGDVWAAGYSRSSSVQPLILRGDGGSWALENAPAGAGINPWLSAVSRTLDGGPWAVGTASNGTSDRTLILKGPAG
jgi:hypothetical protein